MSANPIRGQVEIEIGGTARILRITYNVICNVEHALDLNFQEIIKDLRFEYARELMFHGLQHSEKGLTRVKVGEWIEDAGLSYVLEKLAEAIGKMNAGLTGEKEAESGPLDPAFEPNREDQ